MSALALELEPDPRAVLRAPEELAPAAAAPVCTSCDQLAALPPTLRAGAVGAMQRGEGNAAVARLLSRVAELPQPEPDRAGERCKCGGIIGGDGLCDKCRGERQAGLAEAAQGDGEIARMLAADVAARRAGPPTPTLLRQDAPDGGGGIDAAAGADACSSRCGDVPSECPPSFCCPFPTGTATIIREQMRVPILAGIASQVTPSVVPVWITWFNGGSGLLDFSSRFGADFASDPTTARVAPEVAANVATSLDATQVQALAAGAAPGATVSLLPALPANYKAEMTAKLESRRPFLMNFTTIGTAPGNLAGGVGKTQTTCSVGATPSPVDDARVLTDVTATLIRNPNGSITVTPTLHFHVVDTVDLCPGNCGSGPADAVINEQLATVPMSRLEASGVAGDVPFFVDFTVGQSAFTVPPPAPPVPQHVVVSASTLFDYGSHDLRSGGEDALAAELGDRPTQADLTQPFTVEGHTDSKGSEEFNQGLSERRAATVVGVLERRYPNVAGHLAPTGFGETRPIAPNDIGGVDNPAGRAQNRRVELRFSAPPPP